MAIPTRDHNLFLGEPEPSIQNANGRCCCVEAYSGLKTFTKHLLYRILASRCSFSIPFPPSAIAPGGCFGSIHFRNKCEDCPYKQQDRRPRIAEVLPSVHLLTHDNQTWHVKDLRPSTQLAHQRLVPESNRHSLKLSFAGCYCRSCHVGNHP